MMANLSLGPSVLQCRYVIGSISTALTSNADITAFQRINREAYKVVTPMIWLDLPSALPLLKLLSSLKPVGQNWLALKGPLQISEIQRFLQHAGHVVQIKVLYDVSDHDGRYVYDTVKELNTIAMQTERKINMFPKLKSVGISCKFSSTYSSSLSSSPIRLDQISSLTVIVRTSMVAVLASLIREFGPTLCALSITGDSVLNSRIITSVQSLTVLNTLILDMTLLDPLEWGANMNDWKDLVEDLPTTVDVIHIIGPPASPIIISALPRWCMQYVCLHTRANSFCAFLSAIEDFDNTPVILRFLDHDMQEDRIREVISFADINVDLCVVGKIAVMHTRETSRLKRPLVSTRGRIESISHECEEVSSQFFPFYL